MPTATLRVHPTSKHALSPLMYSIFFETEINFGGEGGIYAELLQNRDFETLGRGRISDTDSFPSPSGGNHRSLEPTTQSDIAEPAAMPSSVSAAASTAAWTPAQVADAADARVATTAFDDTHAAASNAMPPIAEIQAAAGKPAPAPVPTDFRPWATIGGATAAIDTSTAPFATNPHVLRLRGDALSGVFNPGWLAKGIGIRRGVGYDLTLWAETEGADPINLSVRLCGAGAAADQPGLVLSHANLTVAGGRRGEWQRLQATLPPTTADEPRGRLELLLLQPAEVRLDSVSLFPSDAVVGLFRRDIFDRLAAMGAGFMRTPGGNYLEGTSPSTRWAWKSTLGPAAARRGHFNSAWGYWVTDGLGVYELLLLAEALGCEAQMSVYTGYSIGQHYVPLNASAPFAQDAVDLLDFANADAGAGGWAAVRARMGHPAPFGLRRLEVGNEETDYSAGGYAAHYRLITTAVWQRHPETLVVASGRWGHLAAAGNPCLAGQRCDLWDEHFYDTPDGMARRVGQYDAYNRSWPKVFVGEYAACFGGRESLRAAVAEAAFLIGMETNADVVRASSFAPLLNNVGGTQWAYNLLNFDTTRLYPLPAYHAQRMLSTSLGEVTLHADLVVHGGEGILATSASMGSASRRKRGMANDAAGKTLRRRLSTRASDADVSFKAADVAALKVANYANASRLLRVELDGWGARRLRDVNASVLTAASPDARNTLDDSEAVVPVGMRVKWTPAESAFTVPLPAWSLVVVDLTLEESGVAADIFSV